MSNFDRAWIDGVSDDIQTLPIKLLLMKSQHTQTHQCCFKYGRWKSGKTVDKDSEKITKNNISFWTKVLRRLLSIILTMCSHNLALRGHRETFHDEVCEGASRNLNLVINDAVSSIPGNEKNFTTRGWVFGSSLNRWRDLQIEGEQGSLT